MPERRGQTCALHILVWRLFWSSWMIVPGKAGGRSRNCCLSRAYATVDTATVSGTPRRAPCGAGRGRGRRGASAKEHRPKGALALDPLHLPQREEGDERDKDDEGPGQQFVPALTRDVAHAPGQALAVQQPHQGVLEHAKDEHPQAEQERLEAERKSWEDQKTVPTAEARDELPAELHGENGSPFITRGCLIYPDGSVELCVPCEAGRRLWLMRRDEKGIFDGIDHLVRQRAAKKAAAAAPSAKEG